MKQFKFLAVALAALAMVSCSKDNNTDVDIASKTLRVTVGGKATKAAGDEKSKGDESNIASFAVFAKAGDAGKYVCKLATGTPLTAEMTGVKSNTDVYVIANYANTEISEKEYTEAEIKALQETILKADIEAFGTALRLDSEDPDFGAKAMLMTGYAEKIGNVADADGTILLTVNVDREFSKVDVGTPVVKPSSAFETELTDKSVTVNGIQQYFIRRVAPINNYFGNLSLPTADVADVWPADNGYRIIGAATEKLYYVTRNDAKSKTQSTAVVYKMQYQSTQELIIGGTTYPANAPFSRFYKAYVTNADQTATTTAKNTFFQFNNAITGWGAEDEEGALTEEVDLDVVLTVKDWNVLPIEVDMK